ncbi:MAG TPA: cupredoxin family copper-binding protein [Candidatus Saccharimonadales bacterium]|nr:cupredoxin family copper-binding protein [Candidatus Saccharimonadales bacterium]
MNRKALGLGIGLVVIIIIAVVAAVAIVNQSADNKGHDHASSSHGTAQTDTPNSDKAVATDKVSIEQYAFSPGAITVKAGTTVTWTNLDSVNHTVTSDDNSSIQFDSGDIDKGQTYQFTFEQPGTYHYHCTPHPFMHGTVVVTD